MLKTFNPIIQDTPTLFNEDIYLFSDSGKVLACRNAEKPIRNIFSLIDDEELEFIRENMFFAGLHPLLLVDSSVGPIFIDDSLFGTYRTFLAIIPHFSDEEVFSIVKEKLKPIVLLSPKIKSIIADSSDLELQEAYEDFANMLLMTHRGAYYYRVHGLTNVDLSIMMSEIAYDFSKFCGCEIKLDITGVGLFEMKNDLCIDSYIFALISFLFLARNYSLRRSARMDIFFDEMGIYFDFGFEISSEFRRLSLIKEADELKNFAFRASSRLFDCDYFQNDRIFATRVYPWFRHPDSADLKEPKRKFIYNL